MKTPLLFATLAIFAAAQLRAADTDTATNAINALGIDLLKGSGKPDENALLSPYSIQDALAMTYAGAAGTTRAEMTKTLHFPEDDAKLNKSFAALEKELAEIEASTRKIVARPRHSGPTEPVTLSVANRIYGQKGYDFRKTFLEVVKENYNAPLEQVDFGNAEGTRKLINGWVADQTKQRIRDLIPKGALDGCAMALVNAIYLKAGWANVFEKGATKPAAFHVNGGAAEDVPTMFNELEYGYAKRDGYTAVSVPYVGSDLQFLVLLPDHADGLAALEAKLTPALLADCAKLQPAAVDLWLPKFKMEPPLMELSAQLEALGMKSAFNPGSANFDGIAPRKPGSNLFISRVFHKTFLSLDENGTEAAAATAVLVNFTGEAMDPNPVKPHEVHVDHPFLFAIQDCKSGACLFLGRVTDPR